MAEILKLAELTEDDGVAEVEVGPARVAPEFNDEGFTGIVRALKFLAEGRFGEDFLDAPADVRKLFVDG